MFRLGQVVQKRFFATGPKLPNKPKKYEGPSFQETLQMRKDYVTPSLITYYGKNPVMIVDGKMQYLFDEKGNRYLDMFAGIVTVSVGHCHPEVNAVMKEQIDHLWHTTTIYLNPKIGEYAKALINTFPKDSGLKVCYFTNSGSEANDLAVMMSRLYTGNWDVIGLRGGYHGGAGTALNLTNLNTWRYPIPDVSGVRAAVNPDPYRGPWKRDDPKAGEKYANDVKNIIETQGPGKVACFIAETIQGVGGSIEFADGYLQNVYPIVRKAGGLCIADEVQAGIGRTGTKFWGYENYSVKPDIVTMAKGIGNGFPMGAVVTTPEIAKVLSQKLHFNTFGGNPLPMVVGKKVLEVIEKEKLQENCLVLGKKLKDGLNQLKKKHPLIGDVRGQGLMLGVEFVRDHQTLEPAGEECGKIQARFRELGILIGKGGLYGNILRIKPPMCINSADVDFVLECMDNALSTYKDVSL